MSDVASGTGGPGEDPEPYVPTGARRSSYLPPEPDAEPPAFDDDALADALAAQVASYTSPIPIVGAPAETPAAPEEAPAAPETPASAPAAEPAASTGGWGTPAPEPTPADLASTDSAPTPVVSPEAPAADPVDAASPTLEAIERLENELRRRADEARVAATGPGPVIPPAAPAEESAPVRPGVPAGTVDPGPPPSDRIFPAPPTFVHSAPPTDSTPAAPPVPTPSFPEPPVVAAPAEPAAPDLPTWDPPAGPEIPTWAPPPAAEQPAAPPSAFEPPATPPSGFEPPVDSPVTPPSAFEPADDSSEPAPATSAPLDPPYWQTPPPPNFAPPPLVEPPAPSGPAPSGAVPSGAVTSGAVPTFAPHPEGADFGAPPATPPVALPPPGAAGPIDFAHLPPPVGLEPAALPPYQPGDDDAVVASPAPIDLTPGPLAPPPADFNALLGGQPPVHPDDLDIAVAPSRSVPPPEAHPVEVDEVDDAVDEVDRVFGTGALVVDPTGSVAIVHPPSQPIPTVQVTEGEEPLLDPEPQRHPALAVEAAGPEPTPLDLRAGRAARMFWLWFATNSSVISLSLGAVLFGLGMNLRQAIVAIVLGVALSFLPLGLVTLAGKWSGQPTMVVSRASFGLVGNVLPTVFAIVSRVFWGAALLWLLAAGIARVLVDAGLDAGLGEGVWTIVVLGAGFLLAFVVAVFGYGLVARVQLVLSIVTGILVVGVIALTASYVNLDVALRADDGSWGLLVPGIVLVFSFVGLAWVHSTADVARYQRTDGDGGSTMLWATFGATLPALLLIAWGALLAASDPILADGLATNPLHTIAALLPIWYPAPLIGAIGLGLLSGVVLTIYSGGFALQALGIRARRSVTTVIAGVLVLAVGAALLFLVGDARDLIRDIATTIAVPIAAWAGIFGAEMMMRRAGFASNDLLERGGVYPAVRWVNLVGLVLISALGFGLSTAALPGLDWQGYLFPLLGVAADSPLASSDLGVLVALGLGILLPLVTAFPTIRRQERALVD